MATTATHAGTRACASETGSSVHHECSPCERSVTAHRIYIVATCDRELKRRLRKIPGVPLISIKERKYQVERMPEAQH